jgi:hypothetical protein
VRNEYMCLCSLAVQNKPTLGNVWLLLALSVIPSAGPIWLMLALTVASTLRIDDKKGVGLISHGSHAAKR